VLVLREGVNFVTLSDVLFSREGLTKGSITYFLLSLEGVYILGDTSVKIHPEIMSKENLVLKVFSLHIDIQQRSQWTG